MVCSVSQQHQAHYVPFICLGDFDLKTWNAACSLHYFRSVEFFICFFLSLFHDSSLCKLENAFVKIVYSEAVLLLCYCTFHDHLPAAWVNTDFGILTLVTCYCCFVVVDAGHALKISPRVTSSLVLNFFGGHSIVGYLIDNYSTARHCVVFICLLPMHYLSECL